MDIFDVLARGGWIFAEGVCGCTMIGCIVYYVWENHTINLDALKDFWKNN